MGCFLTLTENDLKQLKARSANSATAPTDSKNHPAILAWRADPEERGQGARPEKLLVSIDPGVLSAALLHPHMDLDELNTLAAIISEEYSNRGAPPHAATKELELLFIDIAKTQNIPGIAYISGSPLQMLVDLQRHSATWEGYRFELRYAANHAGQIARVCCDNEVDVQMKDGSYRELKSFTRYDTRAFDDVVGQLELDVGRRGIKDVVVVFDGARGRPGSPFVKGLESEMERLSLEYGAKIDWTIEEAG